MVKKNPPSINCQKINPLSMTLINIFLLPGYYRLISLNFETQLLLFMANFMDSNSWETDEIDKGETYEALQDLVPLSVFNLVFKKYTKISGKNGKIKTRDDEPLYEYDQESVCRVFAQAILIASPTTEYSDFMEAWNSAAPASNYYL